uniref:Si:dkey-28k24.2 n=1 Tax=Xiphophorus maculatus TaxID=8083 RepID=A0A3B5QSM4_XIPMA
MRIKDKLIPQLAQEAGMANVKEQLLDIFLELLDEDLRTFQWYLYSSDLEGFTHIPKCKADGLDRPRTVDLVVQTYGYDDAVTVTVIILEKMRQKLLADRLKELCRACGGLSDEREFRQQKSKQMAVEETIKVRDLFKPDQERRIRTVLTQGIPGMGKTVCAQKFTLSWAEGEEHQDITFLFPLPFRELNSFMGGGDSSLMGLLHWFFPQIKPIEKLSDSKVLFIFDGLDESLLPLNFKYNKVLRDETEPAPLDVLITNLITGDLLCNAFVWITCRPAAAGKIPRKYIDQWTEIKGFTEDRWQEYFKKRVSDDALSLRIIDHVKSSKSLYVMCQIPIFCWITVTLIKRMLHDDVTGRLPNTLTEMYVYLLLCQTDRMAERHYPMSGGNVCLQLAELAFRQLEQRKQIFYEADLKKCHMDINEATTYSGVCTEMFHMEAGRGQKVFNFVHLSIQEFLAAVLSSKLWRKSVFGFHKSAIEKALKSPDGHWDLFLRFLLGLSLKSNQELLYGVLHLEAEGEEDVAKTIQFIKEMINEEPESKLNLFHCLGELRDESLVGLRKKLHELQKHGCENRMTWSSSCCPGRESTFLCSCRICIALHFTLHKLAVETVKQFVFETELCTSLFLDCVNVEWRVAAVRPWLLLSQCKLGAGCCGGLASIFNSGSPRLKSLDLSNNNLKDAGVSLLAAGLTSPSCKLEILRSELDLSENDLEDLEVELLSNGIANPNCVLETLR